MTGGAQVPWGQIAAILDRIAKIPQRARKPRGPERPRPHIAAEPASPVLHGRADYDAWSGVHGVRACSAGMSDPNDIAWQIELGYLAYWLVFIVKMAANLLKLAND